MNEMLEEYIKNLGFEIGDSNFFYRKFNNYLITVDRNNYQINYGSKITSDRDTCLNLSHQEETKVVFECVCRLLEIGYKPEKIVLEKSYPSGRNEKGQYLDILIKNNNNDSTFLMIECKTISEYSKELERMENNGSQLFTYYTNDRIAKYLCLYTSEYSSNDNKILYYSNIIDTAKISGSNRDELFEGWSKTFEKTGIFESNCIPYSVEFKGITKKQLRKFSQYDVNIKGNEGTIFNRFAEILRRNTISDKNNAYNKIFNLFLCKIVDEEERGEDEYTWFQWRDCETAEEVLSRLSDLYKKGMDKYLKLDISDISERDLGSLLSDDKNNNDLVIEMFRKLRLYKNNEFAFNEVINERTFQENAIVVKEVVKLLEIYQIKYSSKHQFLGDFFEKLLSIGVKQESGQFFTPIPIANFIVNSIPVEKIVNQKIELCDDDFLPYIIDFACGSGHFLTEMMHRVDKILKLKNPDTLKTLPQKNKYKIWKDDYQWAQEFVYGLELDYRLAKTTKVACFLNGDGEANIYYANGLDSFTSENYYKKLKSSTSNENGKFDIVVANPPYSVKDFQKLIKNGKTDFSLFESLSDKSDDIELIFIERTYQLLNDGGYCGIILPDTILTNCSPAIFTETRKFLLKNFKLVGITHLGEQTFIKTGQTTTVLFMEKRKKADVIIAGNKINRMFEKLISEDNFFDSDLIKYIKEIYNITDIADYIDLVKSTNSIKKEEENYLIYMLNKEVKTIVSKTGKRKEEIEFLGYKHTDMRNYEGIKPYPDNDQNVINSKLFDENNILNPSKLSYYIYNNFLNNVISEEEINNNGLSNNVYVEDLNNLLSFSDDIEQDNNFMILTKDTPELYYDENIYYEDFLDKVTRDGIGNGENAPKSRFFITDEIKDAIFIRANHLNNNDGKNIVIQNDNFFKLDNVNRNKFKSGTIVFPKSGQSVNTNNIAIVPEDCYIVNHLATISVENVILRDYIYYVLKHYKTSNLKLTDTGYPTIRIATIKKFSIPMPHNIKTMENMVKELNDIVRLNKTIDRIFEEEKIILKKYHLIYS